MTLEKTEELIDKHLSTQELLRHNNYIVNEGDISNVRIVAHEAVKMFSSKPNCCSIISAGIVETIVKNSKIPCYLVAGKLSFQGRIIFGGDDSIKKLLNISFDSNVVINDLDAHFWVVCGDYILDASFLITAYHNGTPAWLRNMVNLKFGIVPNYTYILGRHEDLSELELVYTPCRIFTYAEVSCICDSIFQYIEPVN